MSAITDKFRNVQGGQSPQDHDADQISNAAAAGVNTERTEPQRRRAMKRSLRTAHRPMFPRLSGMERDARVKCVLCMKSLLRPLSLWSSVPSAFSPPAGKHRSFTPLPGRDAPVTMLECPGDCPRKTIAPAMKYVDLPSPGGDPRAPRNRLAACFRRVSIADRAGRGPYQHAPYQYISLPHLQFTSSAKRAWRTIKSSSHPK